MLVPSPRGTRTITVTAILSFIACGLAFAQSQTRDSAQTGVTGKDILQGMNTSAGEVKQLEDGGILSYSDKKYESTNRELAADAVALVQTDLAAVHEALKGATTLIPGKVMIEHAEILSEADFAGVNFSSDEFSEVQKLFRAKPGKDFNFSAAEFQQLQSRLRPHQNASRADKISAASAAMRELLIGRYQRYREAGLNGIESYQRSRRKQVDVGRELLLSTETFRPFADDFPQFFRILESYPDGAECCENYFRWLKVKINKRPTFTLAHTIIQQTDDFVLLTERHYFVTSTLNSTQITLSWMPYDEDTYMGVAMSASADILDSMLGKMLRSLGRNKAKDLVTDIMREIRSELEEDASEGAK
jgi:hypothetical protein